MSGHPIDPLLSPRSIALVGASARPDSTGHAMVAMCRIDGFGGAVYPVNPRYRQIDGLPCYPTLADLPETPDHVVIGVASHLCEDVLDQAISLGARAATIFASCHLEGDASPSLTERLTAKARAAGMALCGANCMGFYNPLAGLRVASFPSPAGLQRGGIAWIAQSGSALGALAHNDRRLGFSLCVSTGMELVTTVADYVDWALTQPQTRVVGLFLESVRDPAAFTAALEKAAAQGVPVVALKVGRTETSARMARSHTGAMAGNDAVYSALFRKYGVAQVSDLDEMAATLALFEAGRGAADGRLGTIHDSGGEREMVVDLAEAHGLRFAEITADTAAALAGHLEPGLEAENPLDVFGTNTDYVNRYAALTRILVNDPNVALGLFMSNPRDDYWYAEGYTEAVIRAAAGTAKPLAMVSNYSLGDERVLARRLRDAGVPLIRGSRNALLAAAHAMAWRDFRARPHRAPQAATGDAGVWAQALADGAVLSEHDGLRMLECFGLRIPRMKAVRTRDELEASLGDHAFPIVLKTAEDHAHKSDVGGVRLGLTCAAEALAAYRDLERRLGPKVLVMEMAPKGVEIGLGAVVDPDFGPVVLLSAGGVLVELLDDKVASLAPFDADEARRMLLSLKIAPMLDGIRGGEPVDIEQLTRQIAAFSVMVAGLADSLAEIDVNPLIASPAGCWAVDCLAVAKPRAVA